MLSLKYKQMHTRSTDFRKEGKTEKTENATKTKTLKTKTIGEKNKINKEEIFIDERQSKEIEYKARVTNCVTLMLIFLPCWLLWIHSPLSGILFLVNSETMIFCFFWSFCCLVFIYRMCPAYGPS